MIRDKYVQQTLQQVRTRMEVRGLAAATVTIYLRSIRRFIAHVGKPLGTVKRREVEEFLLDLARRGVHPRTRNVILVALRFAFRGLRRPNPTAGVPMAKAPRRTPEILSGSEVKRLLEATTSLKYRAIFLLAYGAGLRVSEVVGLKTTDIDSQRIHVRAGKTGPRYVMMSPRVLEALRAYWRAFRPTGSQLFPGRGSRNRHCPKCQALRGARWVEARLDRILPVLHFHVVFTLPSDLRELARRNRALVFDLLLKSAAGALLTVGRDPKWFGRPIQLGVTTVLHTWARDLHFHPHAHCIVTGGGLARDGDAWVSASEDFLLPVHVLGALFRGIFLDGLERMRARGLLADDLDDRAARRRRARLYDQSWVVYAKRPFGGAEQVYRYLGRYTHRVAISNHRLVSVDDDAVVFHTHRPNTAALHPVEFIRRFLQHWLPRGFVKIRHGGLLAPGNVNGSLARAKALLPPDDPRSARAVTAAANSERPEPTAPDLPWSDLLLALTGVDLKVCPACHTTGTVRFPLPPPPDCRGPPPKALLN